MLDKKSIAVLKVLNKLSGGSAYKVITTDEVFSSLTQKNSYDFDSIKEIIDFLIKQKKNLVILGSFFTIYKI